MTDFDLQTTKGYIGEIKQRYEVESDYAVAKLLGCTPQRMNQYKNGHTFGEDTALKVAELLELPPGLVLVCMEVERAKKSEVKTAWTEAANSMMKGTKALAVAMLALVAVSFSPSPAQAASGQTFDSGTVYIMSNHTILDYCVLILPSSPVMNGWPKLGMALCAAFATMPGCD